MSQAVLEASGITKRFPGVTALDGVSFRARGGEVHALMGENGAGKSTLIKVLTGAHPRDGGQVLVEGARSTRARRARRRPPASPRSTRRSILSRT